MSLRAPLLFALVLMSAGPALGSPQDLAWPGGVLRQDAAWHVSPEALEIARNVMRSQSPEGGFPKNTDLSISPSGELSPGLTNTFDNGATTTPVRFLARVAEATGDADVRASVERGIDYMLAAQYPNGGWPQFYPLRDGYYSNVTFNDDAMVRVLEVLSDVADGESPYTSIDAARRARAGRAVDAGVALILRTQIRTDAGLTGWCAQYDPETLEPAWARRYEPPSISGSETVGIVRFLMSRPDPTPEIIAAVDGAVAWLEASAMTDQRLERITTPDGARDVRVTPAPGRRLWARFYSLETGRPVFMDRDSVAHDDLSGIDRERRAGYNYVGVWAEDLLARAWPEWRRTVS